MKNGKKNNIQPMALQLQLITCVILMKIFYSRNNSVFLLEDKL